MKNTVDIGSGQLLVNRHDNANTAYRRDIGQAVFIAVVGADGDTGITQTNGGERGAESVNVSAVVTVGDVEMCSVLTFDFKRGSVRKQARAHIHQLTDVVEVSDFVKCLHCLSPKA